MNKYWFKGMKLHISIIADCLAITNREIRNNSKKFNLTIQEYIKSIENCVPQDKAEYTYTMHHRRGGKPSSICIDGMNPFELSKKYGINKSTIYNRYNKGARTIEELTKETWKTSQKLL